MASPSNNRNSSARKTGGKAGGRAGRPSRPIAGTRDRTVRVPKEWNAQVMDPTNNRGGNQRPTGGKAGGRAGLPAGRIAGQSAGTPSVKTAKAPSVRPGGAGNNRGAGQRPTGGQAGGRAGKPSGPIARPQSASPAGSGRVAKAARSLVGKQARAIGAGTAIAGSMLSGDAKGAAITGGTYAAGRLLQALPNPGAKLAGKAMEAAAPFAPGVLNTLSSGSSKSKPKASGSGSRTKADLVGANGARKTFTPSASRARVADYRDAQGNTYDGNSGRLKQAAKPKAQPAQASRPSAQTTVQRAQPASTTQSRRSGTQSRSTSASTSSRVTTSSTTTPSKPRVSAATANRESGNYGTSKSDNKLLGDFIRQRMRDREGANSATNIGPVKDGNTYSGNLNAPSGRGPVSNANEYGNMLKIDKMKAEQKKKRK